MEASPVLSIRKTSAVHFVPRGNIQLLPRPPPVSQHDAVSARNPHVLLVFARDRDLRATLEPPARAHVGHHRARGPHRPGGVDRREHVPQRVRLRHDHRQPARHRDAGRCIRRRSDPRHDADRRRIGSGAHPSPLHRDRLHPLGSHDGRVRARPASRGGGRDGAGGGSRGRRHRGARLRHVLLRFRRQRCRVQRVGHRVDDSREPRPRRRRARDHAAARHADRLRRPGRPHQGRTVVALLRNRRRCDRGRRRDRMAPGAGRAGGRGDHRRLLPRPRVWPASAHDGSESATLRHPGRSRDLRDQHSGLHSLPDHLHSALPAHRRVRDNSCECADARLGRERPRRPGHRPRRQGARDPADGRGS